MLPGGLTSTRSRDLHSSVSGLLPDQGLQVQNGAQGSGLALKALKPLLLDSTSSSAGSPARITSYLHDTLTSGVTLPSA